MKAPAKVIVVSAREVVRLHAVTVAVALACARVPLGLPLPSSVSIRMPSDTLGDTNFLRANFNVEALTHAQKHGKLTLVLPVTSPIFLTEVACAKVADGSKNTAFHAVKSSQFG